MLVMRVGERRVGIAVDDVDDVMQLDAAGVRPAPVPDTDGILLGVARSGGELVSVLHANALVAACAAQTAEDQ